MILENLFLSCRDLLSDKQAGCPEIAHFADIIPVKERIHLPDLRHQFSKRKVAFENGKAFSRWPGYER